MIIHNIGIQFMISRVNPKTIKIILDWFKISKFKKIFE